MMLNTTRRIGNATVIVLILLSAGCASIVSRSTYRVPIRSSVDGTVVTIRDRRGNICATERTPTIVTLRSGSGFFSRAEYTFTFEKDGYYGDIQKRTARMDGWYWGNLVFGGVLGLVIIDPITGAMFKLDENPVNVHLVRAQNRNSSASTKKAIPPAQKTIAVQNVSVPAGQPQQAPVTTTSPAPAIAQAPITTPAPVAQPVVQQPIPAPSPASPTVVPVRTTAPQSQQGLSGTAQKLKQLRDSGTITQEEFEALILRSIQKKGSE